MKKWIRWKAVVPAVLVTAIIVTLWMLFADHLVKRGIEALGTDLVGAKVELAGARLRLSHGDLALTGLRVTDPSQPMKNMVEVSSIAGAISLRGLFLKKAVIDSMAVHGVRFGTPRTTSGAVPQPSEVSLTARQRVESWAKALPIPSLNLQGLVGTAVRLPQIASDSLKSVRQARLVQAQADSMQRVFDAQLHGLDPQPTLDSAKALADRLKAADPRRMPPAQIAATANDVRTMLGRVAALKAKLDTAQGQVNRGMGTLHTAATTLDEARSADLSYVRGLVHLPSFSGPDLSRGMFTKLVTDHLGPVLYWAQMADKYIPPGLDPRRSSGPKRLRLAGTTYHFPVAHALPDFLVRRAAGDVTIGGRTSATGQYQASLTGVTTEPAIYGRPLTFSASRQGGAELRSVSVEGSLDRTTAVAHDSLHALVPGVTIPSFALPGTSATIDPGDSSTIELSLGRRGGELDGTWRLTSDAVRWHRGGDSAAARTAAPLGSAAWAEGLVWSAVASMSHVTIEARISGSLPAPDVAISSNVGDALAANIQHAVGAELQKADAQVRAKVDSMVAAPLAAAKTRLTGLESDVTRRIAQPQQQLSQVQADLNAQLNRLTVVPGVRLPGLPGGIHP